MNVEIRILWNPHKLHFLGRKLNLNRKLAGGVEDKTCHLALSSFFSQLFHLGQKTGILLTLDVVHSMLLWLLVLGRVNRATEKKSVFLPMGLGCKREGGIPVSVSIWQGSKPWAVRLEVSCQFKLLPAFELHSPHIRTKKPIFFLFKSFYAKTLNFSCFSIPVKREKIFKTGKFWKLSASGLSNTLVL